MPKCSSTNLMPKPPSSYASCCFDASTDCMTKIECASGEVVKPRKDWACVKSASNRIANGNAKQEDIEKQCFEQGNFSATKDCLGKDDAKKAEKEERTKIASTFQTAYEACVQNGDQSTASLFKTKSDCYRKTQATQKVNVEDIRKNAEEKALEVAENCGKSSCEAEVKAALENNGADPEKTQQIMENMQRNLVYKKKSECMQGNQAYKTARDEYFAFLRTGDRKANDYKTTRTNKQKALSDATAAASRDCDATVRAAFVKSGGSETELKKAENTGQRNAVANTYKECIKTAMAPFSDLQGKARVQQMQVVQKGCVEEAKVALANTGGDEKEFNKIKEKAAEGELTSALEDCIEEKKGTATNFSSDALAALAKTCDEAAEEKFVAAGGDIKKYQRAKREAAARNSRLKSASCMQVEVDKQAGLSSKSAAERHQIYKAAREKCRTESEKAYVASSGVKSKLTFQKAEEEADAKEFASEIQGCIEGSAEFKETQTDNSLTESAKKIKLAKAEVACNSRAKDFLIQRGLNPERLAEMKSRAAKSSARDEMKGCVETKAEEDEKDDPTKDELEAYQKECREEAKQQFIKTGGKADIFDIEIRDAARKEALDSNTICVENNEQVKALPPNATKESRFRAFKDAATECKEASEKVCIKAGGLKEECSIDKQQEKGVENDMATCIKNNAALNTEMKKPGFNRRSQAGARAYRKAALECNEAVKENYIKNGGDEKKLAERKQAAVKSKVSSTIRSCVGEKMKALIAQNKRASREEYITFQKECDTIAEEKLLEAGGDIGEYNRVKAEGARKAGGDQMKKCAESGIDRTVLAQKKTAKERMDYIKTQMNQIRSKCKEESKEAFIESGGDGDDEIQYKKAMENARPEKIKSSLSSCISDTVGDVSSSDARQRSLLYRQASLKCNQKAKEAFVLSGGDDKKFALQKQKAQRNTVMTAYSACMKEKLLPLQGEKISRDNYTVFQKDCRAVAEQEFQVAGGDVKDFEVVKKAAASNNAVETLQACVQDEVAKKNISKRSSSKDRYNAYKTARTACSKKGEDAFVESGGSVERDEEVNVNLKYKEAIKAAQAKKVAETLRACVTSKVDKSKTGKALAQEYRKAKFECDNRAKDEHLRNGGDPNEFAKDKRNAEVIAIKDAMKTCIKEAILALNSTEDVSEDTKIQFQKQCKEDAREEYRENGGNLEEFELAKKEAARKEASDKMVTCVESSPLLKECGEDKKCRKDKYSTAAENCNADTKAAFVEAGGSIAEFEVEKQKVQKAKVRNTMHTCIQSSAVSRDNFNTALETCTTAELKDKTEATGKDKYFARKKCYKSQAVQTELKALQSAYRTAKKKCADATKVEYAKVGGKTEKFVQEAKKAAVTELRATLRSCIDQKMLEKNVTTFSNKDIRMEIIADCRTDAEEQFQSTGGRVENFQEAQQKAAREQLKEKGVSCMKEYMNANSITSPTKDERKAAASSCSEKKKEDFVKSGGDETLYDLEDDKAQVEAMDEQLQAKVENDADVKALTETTTAATRAAVYESANDAYKEDIKKDFEANGGTEEDFERKQVEVREKAVGFTMRACMEDAFDSLQEKNGREPTETEMKNASISCKRAATTEMQKRGGKTEDFDHALNKAMKDQAGEALSACMDIDEDTATDAEIEAKTIECRPKAKAAMEMSGADSGSSGRRRLIDSRGRVLAEFSSVDLDADTAVDEAGQLAVAKAMHRCQKMAGTDAKKLAACKVKAEKIYKKFGGDKDQMKKKQADGAAKLATADRLACKKSGEASDSECSERAKSLFRSSGGNPDDAASEDVRKTDYTRNVVRKGAVQEAKESFYVCMKTKLGTQFTVAQFKAARDGCRPKALKVFEDAGGTTKQFGALFKKQVRATRIEALSRCGRFAKSEKAKCAEPIKIMAKLLGEKSERDARNEQDGRQEEVARIIEACVRGNGTDCNSKAKRAYMKFGGTETSFDEQKREGLGKTSVDLVSACVKQDGALEKHGADVDACVEAAKDQFKKAGGDEKEHWATKKRNGMKAALDAAQDEAEKTDATPETIREAGKKFYMEELKGDPADFDEKIFEAEIANNAAEIVYKKDKKVEMKVSLDAATITKDDLEKTKKELEDSIKEAINDDAVKEKNDVVEVVTVTCGNPSLYGSKTNIVCHVKANDVSKATNLKARTRKSEFNSKLKEKFNAKTGRRRLNEGRRLSTVSSMQVESSQALTSGTVTSDTSGNANGNGNVNGNGNGNVNGGTKSNTKAPAPAGDDESVILNSSGRHSISIICTIMAVSIAYVLF